MNTIRNLVAMTRGEQVARSTGCRPRARREPICETLEGRQLLSTAASTMGAGMSPWGNPGSFPGGSGGPPSAAQIAQFNGKGGPGGKGIADFAHTGKAGSFTPRAMSAALKADLTTLQTDMTQLQSELPSSVTSAITADQAVISKALESMPRPKQGGAAMAPPSTSSTDPSTGMTTMLEKAGISASQATQIASDFQTYQTDLTTVDPTLQTKIAADQAAITKDGGPTLHAGGAGIGVPGTPPTGQPSA